MDARKDRNLRSLDCKFDDEFPEIEIVLDGYSSESVHSMVHLGDLCIQM